MINGQPREVSTSDGAKIGVTVFEPSKRNHRVVLINSATGVRQRYYADFAAFLRDAGFVVITYDYRGIGESRPDSLRGFSATMSQWGQLDFTAMIRFARTEYPDTHLTVVGHSIGGQILGFSPLSPTVDRIIMVAAQTPYVGNFPGLRESLKLFAFWNLMIPVFSKTIGYFPARRLGLFEDLPAGVALQWARWSRRPNYAFDELPAMKSSFETLEKPALMISFTDDTYAPPKAVRDLMIRYPKVTWEHWELSPAQLNTTHLGHFSLFKSKMKDQLWQRLLNYLNQ